LSTTTNFSHSSVYTSPLAFFSSSCLALLATTFIVAAAARWSSVIHTSQSVNRFFPNTANTPPGIKVSSGPGLHLLWAAAGLSIPPLIPYLIRSDSPFCLAPTKRLTWVSRFLQLLYLPRLGGYNHTSSVFHFLSSWVDPMTHTYYSELSLKHANDFGQMIWGHLWISRHRYLPRPRRMYNCKCINYLPTPAMG
jgi:hypothetical protein